MSFFIRTKEKLKAYEVLEFIFTGWEGKKTSVVRYEIRWRRLESTASEIWCFFFFSYYWKRFWSAALNTRQHCVEDRTWNSCILFCVKSRVITLGMVNNSAENWSVRYRNVISIRVTSYIWEPSLPKKYIKNNTLIPWSRVLPRKMIATWLVKKFHLFMK
jgi:hypothetical protein